MIPKKVVTQEEIEREEALEVARIEYQEVFEVAQGLGKASRRIKSHQPNASRHSSS